MRIAFVTETYPPEVNGVAFTVERAVRYLREQGHHVELWRPAQMGEAAGAQGEGEWLSRGWPIPVYPDLRFGWASVGTLCKRIDAADLQLVHVATPGPLAWNALRAARRMNVAVSADFRTNFHDYGRYYGLGALAPLIRQMLRRFHNSAQLTFVPSRTTLAQLGECGFERLRWLGRGVDTTLFNPMRRRADLRQSWSAQGRPVLLYVGRLAAEKNVELALNAFNSLRRKHSQARMVVVGDGPMRKTLEKRFPSALFLGARHGRDLAEIYASADVFLFPSKSETFGNVTLEAMASGLVVLAFDTAAAADLILPGKSGVLVPLNSDEAFMQAAEMLSDSMLHLMAMRLCARATAERCRWPKVLDSFEEALQQLINERATARDGQQPQVA